MDARRVRGPVRRGGRGDAVDAAEGRSAGKRLKADPGYRRDLEICRSHGISHSHFLGEPAGWTDLDRDEARALAQVEAEECPSCHTFREDWVDEKGKPLKQPVWTTTLYACPGCGTMRTADKQLSDDQRESGARVGLQHLADARANARAAR